MSIERNLYSVNTGSMPAEDELGLIHSAQRCDRQAFGELVARYRDGVVNVIYRMCGDAELAEDAAQEAFIRAWQHLPKYRPEAPFRNWVYRIASNVALDTLRREREMADVDELPIAARTPGPEAVAEQNERAVMVQRAVLALPEASRVVLILREYEGLSYQEIADMVQIPIGTVMSRLNYARTRLRDMLKDILEAS